MSSYVFQHASNRCILHTVQQTRPGPSHQSCLDKAASCSIYCCLSPCVPCCFHIACIHFLVFHQVHHHIELARYACHHDRGHWSPLDHYGPLYLLACANSTAHWRVGVDCGNGIGLSSDCDAFGNLVHNGGCLLPLYLRGSRWSD